MLEMVTILGWDAERERGGGGSYTTPFPPILETVLSKEMYISLSFACGGQGGGRGSEGQVSS